MINAIIIDDEELNISALKVRLSKTPVEIAVISEFTSATNVLNHINELSPDVIFLDIEMPILNGFAFLEKLSIEYSEPKFEVIITTAYNEYAIEALRRSVLDFLTKPINQKDLNNAVLRLNEKLKLKKSANHSNTLSAQNNSIQLLNNRYNKIAIPTLRGITFLQLQDITRLEAQGSYTVFHLVDKKNIISSKPLKDFANIVNQANFVKLHRSNIVNIDHISEYLRGEGGSVLLTDGSEVTVARSEKKEFLERYGL